MVLLLTGLVLMFGGCALLPNSFADRTSGPTACSLISRSDWFVLPVQLPVVEQLEYDLRRPTRVKLVESVVPGTFQDCGARDAKAFVQKNEYPVLLGRRGITTMSVRGDICAPSPTFVIYDVFPGQWKDIYGRPEERSPMEVRLIAALAVTMKRCGVQPDELRFVARKVTDPPAGIRYKGQTQRLAKVPIEYTEFFSGRVFPKQSTELLSDDPEHQAAYWKKQEQLFSENQRRQAERETKRAIGTVLGMILFGAIVDSNLRGD